MQDLKVTLIQSSLHWENADENLRHFQSLIPQFKKSTDLMVLPEMFSTGFSMKASELAEEMNGKTFQWMKQQAKEVNAVITGSVIIRDGEKYFNRLIWMRPDGTHEHYDKRHLFRMGDEHKHYSAGNEKLIVRLNGWNICPLVCYDLRFPVWCRNRSEYDALIFVANWPEKRNFAWKHLLQARAIENQSFVIGVNRIGNDGQGIYHSGDSTMIDPMGEVIFSQPDTPFARTFTISKERLEYVRSKMPFLDDGDDFEVKL